MPFRICHALATFQRFMDLVLAGLKWSSCLVYLDDVPTIIQGASEYLGMVLARLHALKPKPDKCNFFQKEVL